MEFCVKGKFVIAGRDHQHARRVRYPEHRCQCTPYDLTAVWKPPLLVILLD
jgi:hypothetical protein